MNSDLDDLPVKLKIVLMGDSSVGKTSIIENYVKHKFRNYYEVQHCSFSRPSQSTSTPRTSNTIIEHINYKFGIQPARKDLSH